jgi:hypothetical protein
MPTPFLSIQRPTIGGIGVEMQFSLSAIDIRACIMRG